MKGVFSGLIATALLLASSSASAVVVDWTDWTSAGISTVTGSIGTVDVTYTGPYSFAELGSGTDYWTEGTPAPYTGNSVIDNAPTASEMIALSSAGTHTITFSEALLNPVMAIVSLGRGSLPVTYDFDTSFTVLSEGQGFWGDGTYTTAAGDILTGYEFHGAIQFNGLVSSISWTSDPSEYWHGITIGALTSSVPEPSVLALMGIGLAGVGFARRKKT